MYCPRVTYACTTYLLTYLLIYLLIYSLTQVSTSSVTSDSTTNVNRGNRPNEIVWTMYERKSSTVKPSKTEKIRY